MNTHERDMTVALETVTRRIGQFEPELCSSLRGTYRLHLQEDTGPARELSISITEQAAVLSQEHSGPVDLLMRLRGDDFVALISGATDPLTLFTNERMSFHDSDGNALPFSTGRKLLQMLLVEWRIDSKAIAAIESHGSIAEDRVLLDRVRTLSTGEFLERYAYRGLPVIVSGAVSSWKLSRYTPEALCDQVGDYPIAVFSSAAPAASSSGTTGRPVSAVGRTFTKMPLREFIQANFLEPKYIKHLAHSAPYLTAHSMPDKLLDLIEYPPFFDRRAFVRPKIWAGPSNTLTMLHRDLVDNFLAQVWGFKHLRLVSPLHTRKLSPDHEGHNPYYEPSKLNLDNPDLESFPDCAEVPYIECVLIPGDLLYLPAGWWHHVRSLEPSLSINFFALHQKPMRLAMVRE